MSGSYSSVWADPQQGGQRNGLSKEKPAIDRVVVPKSSLPFATQAGTVAQWTNNGTCSSGQGTWINNSWIVYINWCDDALYKTDGVQNIMLSDPLDEYYCDSHPDVNKTGTLIAFQRNMYNQVGDYCSALWIMDINGGNQQQVIPCAPNVGGAHEPKWSPDGKYIAYTQGFEDHDYKELYVVGFPATIKLPTRLTFNANYPHHNLQWLTTSVG